MQHDGEPLPTEPLPTAAAESRRYHASPAAPPGAAVREYRRPMRAAWWLERGPYRRFMLREATSVFVTGYALFLLALAGLGPAAFESVLTHPLSAALHVPALLMAVYHSVTWFSLTPQVIVLWRGRRRVSPRLIAGAHIVVWIAASLAVLGIAIAWSGG